MRDKESPYEALIKEYPDLFGQVDKPMTETCMCWGVECGPGWLDLLKWTCARLREASQKYELAIVFEQVKEKFGTLRIYHNTRLNGPGWRERKGCARVVTALGRLRSWLTRSMRKPYPERDVFDRMCLRINLVVLRVENWLHYNRWVLPKHRWNKRIVEGVNWKEAEDEVDRIIATAEMVSGLVCETCGSTVGVTTAGPGWIVTLCRNCRDCRKELTA